IRVMVEEKAQQLQIGRADVTAQEEVAVGLDHVVPFLLEDRLKERGGVYSKTADFAPYVQVDGLLVTGQKPASSGPGAEALLKLLRSA
ncbi:MAG TPA: hypothetical protein VE844_07760, partial [Gammaproteobacteria bacterium]|nr:hypothetical protein [Gammaproteobacteria bacterium]